MDDADLIEAAWAFNVKLECSGRTREDAEIALGGAILNLHDLDGILDRIEALSARLNVAEQMASAATSFLKGCDGGMVSVRQDKALRQALTAWKEG